MAKRLQQTLADYVVIAISPALIMTLVGSLVFFLITVFYQGDYPARLHWVMACFVFAAVLIGRISIEKGLERAMMFGVALAIVVGIAMNSLVYVQGSALGALADLVNWGLIGVVWWCAHKLTWDCTVIDDSQDASGEGLLQVAGLERSSDTPDPANATEQTPEGTTSRDVPAGWWQRYVEHQRRPHAPGVWVVYFSLAALPLFGLGQWLIPASDTGTRMYVFWLLSVYVASGLGLLLTTSFLGLRRYLRQRRIEMPTLMANVWLSTGAVLILVLLAISALLPRPSAEYAISRLPFSVGSPDGRSSDHAPTRQEGVDDAEREGPAPDREDSPSEADSEKAVSQDDGSEGNGAADDSDTKSSNGGDAKGRSDGDSRSDDSSRSPSDRSSSPDSSNQKQPGENTQSDSVDRQRQSAKGGQDGQTAADERTGELARQPERRKRLKESRQKRSGSREQQATAKNDPTREDPQKGDPRKDEPLRDDPPSDQPPDAPDNRPEQPGEPRETDQRQDEPDGELAERSDEAPEAEQDADSSSGFQVPSAAEAPLGLLAQLFRWALYAAIVLAVLYFVWRYRAEVLAALRDFLSGWRDFWDGLFGRRRPRSRAEEQPVMISVPAAPFSTFADPFATGVARRYPIDELVRYTFEAFEAWAREHGCQREPEQTAHELARDVSKLNAPMAADAKNMAELYARVAYAEGELPDGALQQLEHAWRAMRQRSGQPG